MLESLGWLTPGLQANKNYLKQPIKLLRHHMIIPSQLRLIQENTNYISNVCKLPVIYVPLPHLLSGYGTVYLPTT